jgi:5'-nucleotidase
VKKLDILCDMDCIVVDLMGPWIERWNARGGRQVKMEEINVWNTASLFGKEFSDVIDEPGFFRHLPALPGALDGLQQLLADGHNVVLVSACSERAASDKIAWIKEYAPFMKDRAFISVGKTPKVQVEGHILIDDGPHNLVAYQEKRTEAITLSIEWPYNISDPQMDKLDQHRHLNCGSWQDTKFAWSMILAAVREEAWLWPS